MNNYEVTDNNGVIHAGTQDEMSEAFEVMSMSSDAYMEQYGSEITKSEYIRLIDKWVTDWVGDLKLVHVHNRYK